MDSVSFICIDIRITTRDASSGGEVSHEWVEMPGCLDASDIEDYVIDFFGEPLDLEVDSNSSSGEVVRGWVFPHRHSGARGSNSDGMETIVVPFVRFPDGSRRELFDYAAELDSEFRALVQSIAPGAVVPGQPAPSGPGPRLENELLQLCSSDIELIELQISGWLARAVSDGHTYLVFDLAETGRYVQFVTFEPRVLRGEVVGDQHLGGHTPLSVEERQRIRDIGWKDPAACSRRCGNYWSAWFFDPFTSVKFQAAHDVNITEAAHYAARTLCRVFGVTERTDVEVTVGSARRNGD